MREWHDVVGAACQGAAQGPCGGLDDLTTIKYVCALGEPVILKGSPVSSWPAMTRWSDSSYLTEKVSALKDTAVQVKDDFPLFKFQSHDA